jgi:hypothetical protein
LEWVAKAVFDVIGAKNDEKRRFGGLFWTFLMIFEKAASNPLDPYACFLSDMPRHHFLSVISFFQPGQLRFCNTAARQAPLEQSVKGSAKSERS